MSCTYSAKVGRDLVGKTLVLSWFIHVKNGAYGENGKEQGPDKRNGLV